MTGDATETGFQGWITLTSLQFGTGRSISSNVGSTTNREAAPPVLSDVTVTKSLDASSSQLFRASVSLGQGDTVQIAATKTGSHGEAYLQYTLTDVIISSYSISTSGDRPTEHISISCAQFSMTTIMTDSANNPLNPVTTGYDLSKNTPV
jgi:type VI secretion system secreted protein Hcp